MGLKHILAYLLPAEFRAHIRGDLAERGDRLSDFATALPAAWIGHLRRYLFREWIGAVPAFTDATDAALERRTAQITRSLRIGSAIWIWSILVPVGRSFFDGQWALVPGFVCAVLILYRMRARPAEPGQSAREQYRQAILNRRLPIAALGPFMTWILVVQGLRNLFHKPWGVPLVFVGLAISAGLTFYRRRRLTQEREAFLQ